MMKRLSKCEVQKNIWVLSSIAVGLLLGYSVRVEVAAWCLAILLCATVFWIGYYAVSQWRGTWRDCE